MARALTLDFFRERILTAIRLGLSYQRACRLAGVSYGTFMLWREKGMQQKSGVYRTFLEQVQQAVVEGEEAKLRIIHEAAAGGRRIVETRTVTGTRPDGCYEETVTVEKETLPNWQAAGWILARRHPKQWSKIVPRTDVPKEGDEYFHKDKIKEALQELNPFPTPAEDVQEKEDKEAPVTPTEPNDVK